MNKVILLLLVVCLVSVHAYVKRDAPAADNAQANNFLDEAGKQIKEGWKEFTDKVNPDTIKKGFGDALDSLNKALAELKPAEAPKA